VHLTPALALVPVFNICQLIKEIFQGDYRSLTMGITLAANCAYAAAAYVAAVRIFKEERVLFRS
jgi:ABC-type Na+ efflux pump permease subunit